MAKARS